MVYPHFVFFLRYNNNQITNNSVSSSHMLIELPVLKINDVLSLFIIISCWAIEIQSPWEFLMANEQFWGKESNHTYIINLKTDTILNYGSNSKEQEGWCWKLLSNDHLSSPIALFCMFNFMILFKTKLVYTSTYKQNHEDKTLGNRKK